MGKRERKIDKVEEEKEITGDVFEVETILDIRVQKGRVQYCIRWKGFTSDYDTWEDEDNVAGCPELVKEFEKTRELKKKVKKRKHVIVEEDLIGPESSSSSASASKTSPPSTSSSKPTTTSTSSETKNSITSEEKIKNDYIKCGVPYVEGVGFENGDCLEEIVGCKPFGENNSLYFYVKWRGNEKLSWISNESIKQKEPLQLIEFYENRLKFGYKGEEN
ncbi:hypothetical protein RB653_006679 [Dictyostelium firmibasis]|uniref:Chromo domain-containing protein n=1 Tax=Dictyostelium firmibasis TaxID=79012 RepID=A0AAN7TTE6_9MYCE